MNLLHAFLLTLLLIPLLYFNKKSTQLKWKHTRNRRNAMKVWKTINNINGEYHQAKTFNYLRKIDPFVFEELLLSAFQHKGYYAIRNEKYTGDGGIDGQLINSNKETLLIQAKRYSNHIKRHHLEEFAETISKHPKANGGYFVHTGKTGPIIYKTLSKYPNIKLISGQKLISLLQKD